MIALAAIGLYPLTRRRSADPLTLALVAWAVAFVTMFAVGVMRVDPAYQRYSFEFVTRVTYAVYPAAVVLAGLGAAWAWRSGTAWRVAAVLLLGSALTIGVREWVGFWR